MRYYFAPMEGVTGYLYRKVHRRYFPGVDKYFMPFLSPTQEHVFPKKVLDELDPEHNRGIPVVPQLLTRRAEDFIWAAGELAARGYREVNLNLGCPSGTVTAKGKGAGFLARPEELDRLLEEIFARAALPISIKTRLGVKDSGEFPRLLEIFARYPVCELIIHPRVRADFYRGQVRRDVFGWALGRWEGPLCYNGDLAAAADCAALEAAFPTVDRVMIGRGLIADPALVTRIKGGPAADKAVLRAFHDSLFEDYCQAFGSRLNAMARMKEVWFYLIHLFAGGERQAKALRKASDPLVYQRVVAEIFRELPLLEKASADWVSPPGAAGAAEK